MGNEESKSKVDHHGDQQIKIINTQQEHAEKLENHEFLLYMILAVVLISLALNLILECKRYFNKKALRKARSMVALAEVQVSK